jgi:hypothetical protein
MGYWNHRIVRRTFESAEVAYSIHEAFYDDEDRVRAITSDSVGPEGETLDELRESYFELAEAFGRPVLEHDKIPEEGASSFEEEFSHLVEEDPPE